MKRKFLLFSFLFILLMTLFGCASDNRGHDFDPDQKNGFTNELVVYSSERKIIYNVSANLYIEEDYQKKVDSLKKSINADEWTDYERIGDYSADIIFRIKTSRLDEFIDSLSTFGTVKDLEKNAIDVSLQYSDTSNQIMALEAERERLVELFDEANIEEIIQINTRISQIDKELRVLKGEIIQYDSKIEYSEVHISIYNEAPEEDTTYWEKLKQSFNFGIKAFVKFFEYLSLIFVTVFPFLLLFAVIGVSAYYLRKLYLKKKKSKLKKVSDISQKP